MKSTMRLHRWAKSLDSERLIKWAAFAILVPLLPVFIRLAQLVLKTEGSSLSFGKVFGDGELLILSIVVISAGVGDLLFQERRPSQSRAIRGFAGSVGVILILTGFGFYVQGLAGAQQAADSVEAAKQDSPSQIVDRRNSILGLTRDITRTTRQLASDTSAIGETTNSGEKNRYRNLSDNDSAALDGELNRLSAVSAGHLDDVEAATALVDTRATALGVVSLLAFGVALTFGLWCVLLTNEPPLQEGGHAAEARNST